jgi:hypothetical protein
MPDPLNRTIERLSAEFRPFVNPDEVTGVVAQCRRELNTAPRRARPELVEQLARRRLADATGYSYTRAVDRGLFAGSSVRVVVRFGTVGHATGGRRRPPAERRIASPTTRRLRME